MEDIFQKDPKHPWQQETTTKPKTVNKLTKTNKQTLARAAKLKLITDSVTEFKNSSAIFSGKLLPEKCINLTFKK